MTLLRSTDPFLAFTDDTYTIDRETFKAQSNNVDTTTVVHLLVGAGTTSDCPGALPPTPTRTSTPTSTATPTPHTGPGIGPDIALGDPDGLSVAINAVTAAVNEYDRLHFDVAFRASNGVIASSPIVRFDGTGSVLSTGAQFVTTCNIAILTTEEAVGDCRAVNNRVTAAGRLALVRFQATGDGCIDVVLRMQPGSTMFATYTRDAQTEAAQSNHVDTDRVVHLLVGSGAVTDCPGTPPLTPTRTPGSPDDTPVSPPRATATATGTATNTPTGHPFIRLGEVNGLDVPVEASTAAESPFDEFVLQVRTRASYGVEWYGLDGTGSRFAARYGRPRRGAVRLGLVG